MDNGHYHPTEVVSDKISSMLLFNDKIALHITRGVRWDSDHVARPSVEAGFHSILKTFVVHTHSVYANLAACSTACRPIAAQAFAGANYTWGWVPTPIPAQTRPSLFGMNCAA